VSTVRSVECGITERLFTLAESEGIPVMGVGPCTALENEPPGYRPRDLLRGAKSMVCFGLPVPDAVYVAGSHRIEIVWRSQNLYYRRLDTMSLRLAQTLEETGMRALPIFGCMPQAIDKRGVLVGYLNMIRMAEVAGIGVIGRNGLLLNSRYGSRLMLGGVVTAADLPAARNHETQEPGCPADCRICLDACPVHAISGKKRGVHVMRCLGYTARTPIMSRLYFGLLTKLNPEAAANYMNPRAFDEHAMHVCSRCVALCPYNGQDPAAAV
jgi:epoxyqueuosine reductase